MKSIHFTNAYHERSGGIRTFYHALLRAANEHGRHVRLVVPAARERIEDVGPYARIYHVKAPRSPVVDHRYRLLLPHRFLAPGVGRLWQILDDERPDLVEICDKYSLCYLGGLLRRPPRHRRPVVVGLSCERMDDNVRAFLSHHRTADRFARWYVERVYVPQFDAHIAVSPYTAGELQTQARPVHVCGMGVDVETFSVRRRDERQRQALRDSVGATEGTILLVYAGRVSAEKNIDLLLDCCARLPAARSYRLLVVGDGPQREAFEARVAREFPGSVHVRSTIDNREALASLVANCDVFVHPNPREPFGIGPLEAMASGVPLVAPDSGGVRAYANADNAWLAQAEAGAFAAAIASVVDDATLRAQRIARAVETAGRHNWSTVTTAFFSVYDEIAARFRAQAAAEESANRSRRSEPGSRIREVG